VALTVPPIILTPVEVGVSPVSQVTVADTILLSVKVALTLTVELIAMGAAGTVIVFSIGSLLVTVTVCVFATAALPLISVTFQVIVVVPTG
jgi:hypothetical protein